MSYAGYDHWKTTEPDRDEPPATYEVEVWDIINGDLIKKVWEASEEELCAIEEWYRDQPQYEVIARRP